MEHERSNIVFLFTDNQCRKKTLQSFQRELCEYCQHNFSHKKRAIISLILSIMVVYVVMGVCGSGKSTIAMRLFKELNCSQRDADDFHSIANKEKMSSGIPLTDSDREPWLLSIHSYIKTLKNETSIVTCSALKKKYRNILINGLACNSNDMQTNVTFIYLKGSFETISERLKNRQGHFFPPSLLRSQLEILEEPEVPEIFVTVDICESVDTIINELLSRI